ncbi:hypothetical protein [Streptomyces antarcticus]|uniref:hypothetical protein n=1 Tax=Streptomyces antarcticus TaxID=2996458 RepID=UPI002271AB84|nr:hypothetical protein [Streptomyces sp. H34-AA3]MCY0945348.1 hypothetical protein [Streptomyces sp. H34-AA3]
MTSYLLFSSPACVPCQRMKPLIAQESITADVTVTHIVTPDDLFEVLEVTGVKSQADLIVFFEETS